MGCEARQSRLVVRIVFLLRTARNELYINAHIRSLLTRGGNMKKKILMGSCLVIIAALISIGVTPSATGQAKTGKAGAEQLITVLNPAISTKVVERVPLTPRLDTVEGKTIYMYDMQWGGPEAAYSVYEEIQGWFARNMPSVKAVIYRGTGWMSDDKGFIKEVTAKKVDGVIIGIAG
jgi:hypothetical protein